MPNALIAVSGIKIGSDDKFGVVVLNFQKIAQFPLGGRFIVDA